MSRKFILWAFIVSLCLSFLLYGNTIKGEFVWDDVFFTKREELSKAQHLPKLFLEPVLPNSSASGLYRPFTMATFSLNLILNGKHPLGFHITSIVLNAFASFLILLLVFGLFKNKTLAIFSALFFAFLPIHTEAVALMKARDELLGTVFMLLAWLAFLRATNVEKINKKWLLASAGIFFIGILSKEFIITAPALFYLVHWIQKGIRPLKPRVRELGWGLLFFGVFLGIYLLMRHIAIPGKMFGDDDIGPLSNVLVMPARFVAFMTAFKLLFLYVSKIFVPINLSASYHFKAVTLVLNIFYSWRAMLGVVFMGIFIFFASWKKIRETAVGIGALTFLVLYLPVSQLLFIGGDIMGERWMYLPSIGIAMIVGWFFTTIFKWRKIVAIIIFIALLAWYAAILIPRNLVWRNELSLFTSMVHDSPKSVRGYASLAQYYFEHDDREKAAEMVNKGFDISDQEPNLYIIAASIAYKQGKIVQAEELLKKALDLDTFSAVAVLNFPRILFVQEKYNEALLWFNEFISLLPPASLDLSDKILYASILSKLGDYPKSNIYIFDKLADYLDNQDVGKLIAVNYYYLGDTAKALQYFQGEKGQTDQEKIKILKKFDIKK